jgi:hypothetical protein
MHTMPIHQQFLGWQDDSGYEKNDSEGEALGRISFNGSGVLFEKAGISLKDVDQLLLAVI